MQRLSDILPPLLTRMKLDKAAAAHRALSLWAEVVGPEVARHAKPRRVSGDVLWVDVDSSAWASELARLKPGILARLVKALEKERMRKDSLVDIRFRVRASTGQRSDPDASRRERSQSDCTEGGSQGPDDLWQGTLEACSGDSSVQMAAEIWRALEDAIHAYRLLTKARLARGWRICRRCRRPLDSAVRESSAADSTVGDCPACSGSSLVQTIKGILGQAPWLTYDDVAVALGYHGAEGDDFRDAYVAAREVLEREWTARLEALRESRPDGADVRSTAASIIMLKTGLRPENLGKEIVCRFLASVGEKGE